MNSGELGGLDLKLMGQIIETWDLLEAADPDMTYEAMMGLICLTCYCEPWDLSRALIWAGRMP